MNAALTVSTANLLLEQTAECSTARPAVPRDEMRYQLEQHRTKVDLAAEYASIPLASTSCKTVVQSLTINEAIPYEFNRVALPPTPSNPTGYYNASMVDVACLRLSRRLSSRLRDSALNAQPSTVSSYQTSSCPDAAHAFVVAASPRTDSERSNFWRSVWHSGAKVVAQIDNVALNDVCCCLGDQERFVCEDGLQVQLVDKASDSMPARLVQLISFAGVGEDDVVVRPRRCRDVWMLRYSGGWTGGGWVPSSLRDFLTFLDELDALRRAIQLQQQQQQSELSAELDHNDREVRLMLHCSDGASHCGLALCTLVYRACLQHNLSLSLPTVLCALRGQRMRLVASPNQYRFVYDAVIESLEDTRLI